MQNPPWQILKVNQSGDVIEYGGLIFDIMKQLSTTLNFTMKIEIIKRWNADLNFTQTTYNDTGSVLTNEIPDTLLELVKNRSVAFAACAVSITSNLKHHINYTIPISTQSYNLLVARPRELSRALLFISPFTGDVSNNRKMFKLILKLLLSKIILKT